MKNLQIKLICMTEIIFQQLFKNKPGIYSPAERSHMIVYNTRLEQYKTVLIEEKDLICNIQTLTNPETVYQVCRDVLQMIDYTEEYIFVFALTTKGRILGTFEVSHGTVDSSLVQPREILMKLLLIGASSFILVHNHPSQDTQPSTADIQITQRIWQAGKLIGIEFSDHIIVSNEGYYSLKAHRCFPFGER